MIYDFNADDIFEMAEQMERNGIKFYTTAAENVTDDDGKSLFIFILLQMSLWKPPYLITTAINQKEQRLFLLAPVYNRSR